MRRKKDSDGYTIYVSDPEVQEGYGIFDSIMNVGRNVGKTVITKLTGETAKSMAKKAAEKFVEKGSEKIGSKMGEIASNKIEEIVTKPKVVVPKPKVVVPKPKITHEDKGEQIVTLLKDEEKVDNSLSKRFDLLLR